MFSGLTNQVTSSMGSVKADQEENLPTRMEDTNAIVIPCKKDGIPSRQGDSKLEMFWNLKNQIEGIGGWLGSSIPKLIKGENEGVPEGQEYVAAENPATPAPDSAPPQYYDDNASSTVAVAEKDGQFTDVQNNALAGAQSFGTFLCSAVNKAGKTVSEVSAKIKETVETNSILGEFSKEQEAFVKGRAVAPAAALPLWIGSANEEAVKDECLSLSTDKRNFVRSPPACVDFRFDYEVSYPVAMAIMEKDHNLEKMRYKLVPKIISEENFWRNYFYRISLICQANELSFMCKEGESQAATDSSDDLKDSAIKDMHEFVSDTVQTSNEDLKQVQKEMKKMAVGIVTNEEDWEKELEAELQDCELVNEHRVTNSNSNNWEQEIMDMLQDATDLK